MLHRATCRPTHSGSPHAMILRYPDHGRYGPATSGSYRIGSCGYDRHRATPSPTNTARPSLNSRQVQSSRQPRRDSHSWSLGTISRTRNQPRKSRQPQHPNRLESDYTTHSQQKIPSSPKAASHSTRITPKRITPPTPPQKNPGPEKGGQPRPRIEAETETPITGTQPKDPHT